MYIHDATEQAYKNGYIAGKKVGTITGLKIAKGIITEKILKDTFRYETLLQIDKFIKKIGESDE